LVVVTAIVLPAENQALTTNDHSMIIEIMSINDLVLPQLAHSAGIKHGIKFVQQICAAS
jgi:hypothetical protein